MQREVNHLVEFVILIQAQNSARAFKGFVFVIVVVQMIVSRLGCSQNTNYYQYNITCTLIE